MELTDICLESDAAQPPIETQVDCAQSRGKITQDYPDGDGYPAVRNFKCHQRLQWKYRNFPSFSWVAPVALWPKRGQGMRESSKVLCFLESMPLEGWITLWTESIGF